jgi:AraC-like DNA-binding protein
VPFAAAKVGADLRAVHLLALILFAAAIQGLFLAYLLANRHGASREHRLLAALVVVLSVSLLGPVLGLSGYFRQWPHLIRVGDPLVLLYGPLLFFHVKAITGRSHGKRVWLHFVPFMGYLLSQLPFYLLSEQEKVAFGEQVLLGGSLSPPVALILSVRTLHILCYATWSIVLIMRYQRDLRDRFSAIETIDLHRALTLLRVFTVFTVLSIVITGACLFLHVNFVVLNGIIGLFLGASIYALAYSTWNRPPVPALVPLVPELSSMAPASTPAQVPVDVTLVAVDPALVPAPAPTPTPATAPPAPAPLAPPTGRLRLHLSDAQYVALAQRLRHVLEEERAYLESELSLNQLSERMGAPAYLVSEVISRHYQASFFDTVNRFRVDEVKRRLTDPAHDHLNILGVAMDCGFNTKSSFNAAFKKHTGRTPSEFRKS